MMLENQGKEKKKCNANAEEVREECSFRSLETAYPILILPVISVTESGKKRQHIGERLMDPRWGSERFHKWESKEINELSNESKNSKRRNNAPRHDVPDIGKWNRKMRKRKKKEKTKKQGREGRMDEFHSSSCLSSSELHQENQLTRAQGVEIPSASQSQDLRKMVNSQRRRDGGEDDSGCSSWSKASDDGMGRNE